MDVEVLASTDQVIHALVKRQNQPEWLLSAIYANPNPQINKGSSPGVSPAS